MTSTRPEIRVEPVRPSVEDPGAVRVRARNRIRGIGVLLLLGLNVAAARGVQLAVAPYEETQVLAAQKRWTSVTVQGERGTIYDAEGNPLARSVRHPAVALDPRAVAVQVAKGTITVDGFARDLAALLGKPVPEVLAALEGVDAWARYAATEPPKPELDEALKRLKAYVMLADEVHPQVADGIKDSGLVRRGVILEQNYRRFYPQGTFAAQLVGFVDGDSVGQQGLERFFHGQLRGGDVVSQHRVDRKGRVVEAWQADDRTVAGHDVHTTIDRVIQREAEDALAQILADHQPVSATAVVVEVKTGRILAMATAPSFDPNDVAALVDTEDFARTQNLAVGAAIEPGSVFKPFTLAAAIESGAVTLDTLIPTSSPYLLYNARIRDDHPHPAVTAAQMVQFSSNIAAAKIAQMAATKMGGGDWQAGADWMLGVYRRFGFGDPTGIDTQGEAAGVRRPRSNFGPVELATISFGQGVTTTALQLAMATAAIGNGGVRMQPILVDRVTDAYDHVLRRWEPTVATRVVSPETARLVTRAMEMVIEEHGTGKLAAIPGYVVAGKTGTAQKPGSGGGYGAARRSTFIGFAPSQAPEVAMAIIVDEPTVGSRYGGIVAAPAFSRVVGAALHRLGVPEDPALLAVAPPKGDPHAREGAADTDPGEVTFLWDGDAWTMPDLSGRSLRDALAGLQGTGLGIVVDGSGLLAVQEPRAGAPVRPGDTVRLSFQ